MDLDVAVRWNKGDVARRKLVMIKKKQDYYKNVK